MSAAVPPSLLAPHQANNQDTAQGWAIYAPHRARVMSLVPAGDGAAIAILGAGNCNDVDLAGLLARFATVHLVEIDDRAVGRALARLEAPARARVVVHAVDLSGVGAELDDWRQAAPTRAALDGLATAAIARLCDRLAGGFDVVVSSGLLSQLMWTCVRTLGAGHAELDAIAQTVARIHLGSAVELTRPGGTLVLAVDAVPNDKLPVERLVQQMGADALLAEVIARRGCYPGTSPAFVGKVLRDAGSLAAVTITPPWLWRISPRRAHLVYGVVAERRAI